MRIAFTVFGCLCFAVALVAWLMGGSGDGPPSPEEMGNLWRAAVAALVGIGWMVAAAAYRPGPPHSPMAYPPVAPPAARMPGLPAPGQPVPGSYPPPPSSGIPDSPSAYPQPYQTAYPEQRF
jgi:hypothetical protein